MHSYLLLILVVYLLIKGIENIVALVNLRHLSIYGHIVPAGFEGTVDDTTLAKMRDYTVDNGRVDFVSSGIDLILTLVFIFGGLLNWYNSWLATLGWSFVTTGICFFLFLFYAEFVMQIPFGLYKTFVIEEKYGFNRQSFSLWLVDAIKGLVLSTVIYVLLLWVAFWLISFMPHYWWLFSGPLCFFSSFLCSMSLPMSLSRFLISSLP